MEVGRGSGEAPKKKFVSCPEDGLRQVLPGFLQLLKLPSKRDMLAKGNLNVTEAGYLCLTFGGGVDGERRNNTLGREENVSPDDASHDKGLRDCTASGKQKKGI